MLPEPFTLDLLPKACIAALALLLFLLSLSVTVARLRTKRLVGVPDDPGSLLLKLARAQGNTAEYAPMLCLLILLQGSASRPGWVSAMMVLAVVARLLFVAGMLASPSLARPNAVRGIGAGGTYLAGIGLILALMAS